MEKGELRMYLFFYDTSARVQFHLRITVHPVKYVHAL